jgi:hypothetical protein
MWAGGLKGRDNGSRDLGVVQDRFLRHLRSCSQGGHGPGVSPCVLLDVCARVTRVDVCTCVLLYACARAMHAGACVNVGVRVL